VINTRKFLKKVTEVFVILAVSLLAPSLSVQTYSLPPDKRYALGIVFSILLYLFLCRMNFNLRVVVLGALTLYLGFFYITPSLARQTVLETMKAFIRGEKLSVFVESYLRLAEIPVKTSYYTLVIVALWTSLIAAIFLISVSVISYFAHSWFLLENLTPPLFKPLSTYLTGTGKIGKRNVFAGIAIAACVFAIDRVLSPKIPSLVLLFTSVSLNTSIALFSVLQIILGRVMSENFRINLMAGSQMGLIAFLIVFNLVFWKKGIIKRFMPRKERIRVFSTFVLGISLMYITLYLLIDVATLTLFPFLLLLVFFNTILMARIEAEFQVLFIASELSFPTFCLMSSLLDIEGLKEFSALTMPALYLALSPLIPAILANIASTVSLYEKKTEKKISLIAYLPAIILMFYLYFALFLSKYGNEIYEVESFLPEVRGLNSNLVCIIIGAFISFIFGLTHILFFKYPIHPVAFIVSPITASYTAIIAVVLVTAIKVVCLKILKGRDYSSALIVAIPSYVVLSAAYLLLTSGR